MQKYRGLTRWILNAFERHFIRTYSCCIQIVLVKVCLRDSTPGNFNIQLRAPVNPWHTLSNSSDTVALKTNLIKQMLWSLKIYFNNNMQHDLRQIYTNIFTACLNMRDNNSSFFPESEIIPFVSWKQRALSELTDCLSLSLSVNANDGSLDSGERYRPRKRQATPEAASTADERRHREAKYEEYCLLCGVGGTNGCQWFNLGHVWIWLNHAEHPFHLI